MKKSIVAVVAVGALAIFFLTGMSDQPDQEKGPKKGPPPGKKGWEPGKIIPPHIRDELDLTEEQERRIAEVEKEVRRKLLDIFTEKQKQHLRDMNDKGPPDKKGKGKKDDQARTPPDDDKGRPVEKIAKELGVTPEQFREAFKKVTPAPKGQLPTKAQRESNRKILSEALGVSPERLDEVMDKYRPEGPNEKKDGKRKKGPAKDDQPHATG
jgi:Spy/CpxP family protein refolding chaperone